MKNQQSKNLDDLINNDQDVSVRNKIVKTTNINVLLNRVRQEKKIKSKKRIFLSLSIIAILFFTSVIVFIN
tara:strand:+ start:196 stop:408 length:213 start_codon:yes stop_codon:yes gene_type:complete